jgi:hypothetical protein
MMIGFTDEPQTIWHVQLHRRYTEKYIGWETYQRDSASFRPSLQLQSLTRLQYQSGLMLLLFVEILHLIGINAIFTQAA